MKQTFAILLLHLVNMTMMRNLSSAFVTPTPKPGVLRVLSASSRSRPVFHPPAFAPRTTPLSLFGGLVGDKKTHAHDDELISFSKLPVDQYPALLEYVRQWAKLLEGEKLTTPFKVVTSDKGAKILFTPKEATYKNKSEERAVEEGTADSETKKKPSMQGGVEIRVEEKNGEVVITAKRCNMDEDTMIREMSEETIVDGLKKAMQVWTKDHTNK
jgi:hypothetical protein